MNPLFFWLTTQTLLIMAPTTPLETFSPQAQLNWRMVNDGVMGGISQSSMEVTADGYGRFSGTVSLENNGGFASCRADVEQFDLNSTTGVQIKVRGDGQVYDFRVRVSGRYSRVSYKNTFETMDGEWQTIRLPWEDFVPSFRGRILSDVPPISAEGIQEIGILIANKQEGPFQLDIDQISAY